MAINENTKSLINALANNDIERAKAYAKCIIANDKTEKNKIWREKTSILLDKKKAAIKELPANLLSLCELIYPDKNFREDMYYLPKQERSVVDEVIRKQKVVERMQALNIPTLNTTLLYGEPGTGKTELAKYIAYKINKPLLVVRFSTLINSYMGGTGKNIGAVFDYFSKNDVILFLDELDTVSGKRNGGQACEGEISRTTACIMQEMDRLSGGGVIIAATNRKDLLDDAILRRFSLRHEVRRVGEDERKGIVMRFWAAVQLDPPFDVQAYAKQEYTPSRIRSDMIKELAVYLEQHEEMTPIEKEIKDAIVIPEYLKETFLLAAQKINNPEKSCKTLEKDTFGIANIASQVSLPEEASFVLGNAARTFYEKKTETIRYSIYVCRTAYEEYHHIEDVTLGVLESWVKALV